MVLVFLPLLCLIPDVAYKFYKRQYKPSFAEFIYRYKRKDDEEFEKLKRGRVLDRKKSFRLPGWRDDSLQID